MAIYRGVIGASDRLKAEDLVFKAVARVASVASIANVGSGDSFSAVEGMQGEDV